MFGMYGAGGLVGALLSAKLHDAIPGRAIMIGVTWLWAGLCAGFVLAPSALWIGALAAVISFLGPPYNVVVTAATYRIAPDDMLGRVRSTAKLVAWGTIPLAGLLGGLLAEHAGAGPALLGLSALLLAMALLTTASPGLRALPATSRASGAPTGDDDLSREH
jgi:predicted MFS family arabinose efflux permease